MLRFFLLANGAQIKQRDDQRRHRGGRPPPQANASFGCRHGGQTPQGGLPSSPPRQEHDEKSFRGNDFTVFSDVEHVCGVRMCNTDHETVQEDNSNVESLRRQLATCQDEMKQLKQAHQKQLDMLRVDHEGELVRMAEVTVEL